MVYEKTQLRAAKIAEQISTCDIWYIILAKFGEATKADIHNKWFTRRVSNRKMSYLLIQS